jgi:hypothetical protein
MGQSKDDWISATGGLFASPLEQRIRMRIRELGEKSRAGGLTATERDELRKLLESLPDDEG